MFADLLSEARSFLPTLLSKRLAVWLATTIGVSGAEVEANLKLIVQGVVTIAYLFAESHRPTQR